MIAQSIGQAFQVAYAEFLRANGIDDPNLLKDVDYQEVLNQQQIFGEELALFSSSDKQKEVSGVIHVNVDVAIHSSVGTSLCHAIPCFAHVVYGHASVLL